MNLVMARHLKGLECLAFEVAYQEIIFNLLLCPEHVTYKSKATESFCNGVPRSSILSLNLTSKSVRKFVRERLDFILIGSMSESIREKLVEQLNDDLFSIHTDWLGDSPATFERPDAWVFLDCVLDETFTNLDLFSLPPTNVGKSHKLFKTIASRAPFLTTLDMDFESTGELSLKMQTAFTKCLSSLKHLTDLTLKQLKSSSFPNGDCKQFLSDLGSSCPHLTSLSLPSFCFDEENLLVLILGERAATIPDSAKGKLWGTDWSHLHKLQIAKENLTPICSSLKKLELKFPTSETKCFCKGFGYTSRAVSSMAFVLRHIQQFEENVCDGYVCSCLVHNANQLLYQIRPENKLQAEFKKIEETFQVDDEHLNKTVNWTFNQPFSGS